MVDQIENKSQENIRKKKNSILNIEKIMMLREEKRHISSTKSKWGALINCQLQHVSSQVTLQTALSPC